MDTKRDKNSSVTEEKQKPDAKGQKKKKWYERIPVHPFDEDDENLK